MLTYSPGNTVHIPHKNHRHFVTSSSLSGKIKIDDCINLTPTKALLDQIKAVYFVDSILPEIEQVFISVAENENVGEHIPHVITWHQQLQGTHEVIHSAYKAVVKKDPGFQNAFKEPVIVAY